MIDDYRLEMAQKEEIADGVVATVAREMDLYECPQDELEDLVESDWQYLYDVKYKSMKQFIEFLDFMEDEVIFMDISDPTTEGLLKNRDWVLCEFIDQEDNRTWYGYANKHYINNHQSLSIMYEKEYLLGESEAY